MWIGHLPSISSLTFEGEALPKFIKNHGLKGHIENLHAKRERKKEPNEQEIVILYASFVDHIVVILVDTIT